MHGNLRIRTSKETVYKENEFNCNDVNTFQINGTRIESEGFQFISEVQIMANQTGYVKCTATNINGTDESESAFYVSGKYK